MTRTSCDSASRENLATLGVSRLAAVNLRVMDPSEAPGRRFDVQLAALVQAREVGLIGRRGHRRRARRPGSAPNVVHPTQPAACKAGSCCPWTPGNPFTKDFWQRTVFHVHL